MASREASSPKIEQLHCSIPTGRISWITTPIVYSGYMEAVLPIAMRWLHIAAVIVLLGGIYYARTVAGDLAAGFKPVAYVAIGAILASGLYNFLSKSPTSRDYQV